MVMYAKIRRMFFREHLSISEIARRTSLTRNTIKKWLKAADGTEPKYRRGPAQTKLKPFESQLILALTADAHRPKRDRRTAVMLYEDIQKQGFTGCYARVTAFIRQWREQSKASSKSAFVPLHFALGEAFQFDWSEEALVIGGIHRKILAAHTKLCASRAFMISAYPSQSHEMLFDAHTRAFTALGGIARRGIYDNMKTAVDKVQPGKGRIINARFFAMTAHYLFDPDFCNVASGWEKGVVEKNVQDARRRVWSEAKKHQFSTFAELNAWLEVQCRQLWTRLYHTAYPQLTIADVLEQEQLYLMPMPTPFDGYTEVLARVSSTCLVTVQRNRYSVPCEYANPRVSVHLYPDCISIYADHQRVAIHTRFYERDRTCYDWLHYIPIIMRKPGALRNGAPFLEMPLPLQKLQLALRQRERLLGDRMMANVLTQVRNHGLEAVTIAVEQVLASGVTSIEHLQNILSRLNTTAMPAPVVTSLKLDTEPLANTARYDQLNAKEKKHA